MKCRGPVVTIVAVLGMALVLLVVNTFTRGGDPAVPPAGSVPAVTGPASPPGTPPSLTTTEPAVGPVGPTPSFPVKARYVGAATTAKGPIPLAITVDGNRAKAYLCDGKKIEAWLQGSAENGVVHLTGRGDNRLTGALTSGAVTGTVLIAGYPEWRFSVEAVAGEHVGIYRASDGGTTTGWIVRDDSGRDQVGIHRDQAGQLRSAPRLDVTALTPAVNTPGAPVLVDGDTDVLPGS